MTNLPKDVVEEEILCRVPARHLKGLRTTCKRWNYLFNNQRFITKHCDKATKELLVLMLTNEFRICPLNINSHVSLEIKSELSLIDPRSSDQFPISKVFHCDGLLLCTSHDTSMLVVWNPCSGQTRRIKAGRVKFARYALGYTKSSSSGSNKSYKVLSYSKVTKTSQIYEFSSDSWRNLDHDISPQGWRFGCVDSNAMVSLNGHTYGFATNLTETHPGIYLLRFDFTSEKASLLVRLPYKTTTYEIVNLSVVREEKLSVLVQTHSASKTEVWVTNKIDDTTTTVSWNKVLSLDFSPRLQISSFGSFLLDEEKKVVMCYERLVDMNEDKLMDKIYCVGEDSKVTEVYLGVSAFDLEGPHILNYVPSLVQMEQVRGNKRRRDE